MEVTNISGAPILGLSEDSENMTADRMEEAARLRCDADKIED
jgi:hypothetical protein